MGLLRQVVAFIRGPLEEHKHLAHASAKAVVRCASAIMAKPELAGEEEKEELVECVVENIGVEMDDTEDGDGKDMDYAEDGEGKEMDGDDTKEPEEFVDDKGGTVDDEGGTEVEEENGKLVPNEEDVMPEEKEDFDVPASTLYERALSGVEKKPEPLTVERSSSSSSPPCLKWSVVRLSHEARKLMINVNHAAVRLGTIVRLFGHFSVLLPPNVLEELLIPLLTPCYRLQSWAKDHASRGIQDLSELASLDNTLLRGCLGKLAQETMEALRKSMGANSESYAQALVQVRSAVMESRRKRKSDKKLFFVQDPERANAHKIKIAGRKKVRRKVRKHEVVKQKRGLLKKGSRA